VFRCSTPFRIPNKATAAEHGAFKGREDVG
jgi:hypothetical protein